MLGTGETETSRDRDRTVNLSDGVFAIALTLLILDIRVPHVPEGLVASELPAELLALWPKYLGYFLSFVVIATFWIIHHSVFRPVRSYDRTLLWLNFLFLMLVAFVPFPTSLLGEYGDHRLPVAVYAATMAAGRLLLTAIHWYTARDGRLLDEPQDPATVRFYVIRGVTIPAIFLLSIAVSVFSVQAAVWSWWSCWWWTPLLCAGEAATEQEGPNRTGRRPKGGPTVNIEPEHQRKRRSHEDPICGPESVFWYREGEGTRRHHGGPQTGSQGS